MDCADHCICDDGHRDGLERNLMRGILDWKSVLEIELQDALLLVDSRALIVLVRLRIVQRSERSRDRLVRLLVIQLGTAVTDDAHLEDRQVVHLDGVTHQRLLTRTLHEVAEDTLDTVQSSSFVV